MTFKRRIDGSHSNIISKQILFVSYILKRRFECYETAKIIVHTLQALNDLTMRVPAIQYNTIHEQIYYINILCFEKNALLMFFKDVNQTKNL